METEEFIIYDTLEDTMVWDDEYNSSAELVYLEGKNQPNTGNWLTLAEAEEYGIHIDFEGQKLTITVDATSPKIPEDVATIDETLITIIVRSVIKDEVMYDHSIKEVKNNSQIDFEFPNDEWEVNESDKSSNVTINRDGSWAEGTKSGTINVFKSVEGTEIGIEDVEFEIRRKDGKDIVIRDVNHGKTLTEKTDSNGELNIKGLPVTTYVITEKGAPNWIEFDPETPIEQEFTIEDKETTDLVILNSKKLTDFTVEKEWFGIDGTSIDGKSIKVQLYRNEEPFGSVVEMKDSHTWEDLEMADDNGNLYVYTAKEVGEDSGKVELSNEEYEVEYIHSDAKTQISNTLIQEKIDIKGEKTWNDLNDKLGLRPESIEISLLANGEVVETLTVTEEDDWKWSFIDLDKYQDGEEIVYSISETSVDHYSSEIDGFNVINAVTPEKTSVQVTKTWDMIHGDLPESVTVKLFANGVDTGRELVLTEDDNWVGTFKGLEMYDENLDRIKYTVEEVHIDGFIVSISGDMENGFVIKNSQINPKVDIKGEKIWNDLNDKLGLRPESIEISLLANGEVVETLTVTEEDDWKWSFIDLDKYHDGEEIVYSISETSVDHYSSEIDGFNVTNTLTPDKTSLQITKVWKDDGTLRPESIVIKLYANGVDIGEELVLTEDDNWVGTFKGLDMYDENLDRIKYTIEEVKVDGYSVSIEGDMDTGYVVTNSYVLEETPVNPPKDKPREPEVASVNRPKPEELPVTGSSSIMLYGALAMVGTGLLILIKKRKESH